MYVLLVTVLVWHATGWIADGLLTLIAQQECCNIDVSDIDEHTEKEQWHIIYGRFISCINEAHV